MIEEHGRIGPPLWIAIAICILSVLVLLGGTAVLWVASSLLAGVDRASSFANTFLIQGIVFTAILGAMVQTRSLVQAGPQGSLGFLRLAPTRWPTVLLAVVVGAAMTVPLSALDGMWQNVWEPGPGEIETMMAIHDPGSNTERVFILLALVAAAPLGEEMLFRGAMWSWIEAASGPRAALLVTSTLFASAHVFLPRTILLILPVGLFLGWLGMRTGSVIASIAAHATFNGLPILASWSGLLVPGWNDPGETAVMIDPAVVAAGTAVLCGCVAAIAVTTGSPGRRGVD